MTVAENSVDERWSNGDANGSRKGRRESGGCKRGARARGEGRGTERCGGSGERRDTVGGVVGGAVRRCERGGGDGGAGGVGAGGGGGGGVGAPISTRRGKPCACATNVASSLSTYPSLSLLLYLRVSRLGVESTRRGLPREGGG